MGGLLAPPSLLSPGRHTAGLAQLGGEEGRWGEGKWGRRGGEVGEVGGEGWERGSGVGGEEEG